MTPAEAETQYQEQGARFTPHEPITPPVKTNSSGLTASGGNQSEGDTSTGNENGNGETTTPDTTGDETDPTKVTEGDKGKNDPDPYTTGPSEIGVSTPERVNYVEEKRHIEERNNDINKLRESRIKQNDPRLQENIRDTGCYFRSIQSAAEDYVKKNLTPDEINESREDLLNKTFEKWDNKEILTVITNDMTVQNADLVINDAFKRLGHPELTGTLGYGGDDTPDSIVIYGNTTAPNKWHYKHADEKCVLIFEPHNPFINITNVKTIKVYIHKKN